MTFQFAQPYWLIAGFCACLALLWFFRHSAHYKQQQLSKFASPQLAEQLICNFSPRKLFLKKMLLLATVFLCFSALARPQYGYKWIDIKRKGIDILFAIDTSYSMLAEDMKPNRLERAKLAIYDLVKKLEGDRVGLLPFAGSSYLMCPLTIDYEAFHHSLNAIDTTIIPQKGTNLAEVINHAEQVLEKNTNNHRILIILTDGENLQGDAIEAAKSAQKNDLLIYTLGVGTHEGELIPLPDGQQGFVKDQEGRLVQSKLDTATLKQIAEVTDGIYRHLGVTGEGLEAIYRKKLALLPKTNQQERRQKVPLERFQWPLGVAFLLYLLEMFLTTRKKEQKKKTGLSFLATHHKTITSCIVCMIFSAPSMQLVFVQKAFAEANSQRSIEAYRKKIETNPEDPYLQYNYGTSLYAKQNYDDAIEAFSKALKSEDLMLQKKAYFNRGNGYYYMGEKNIQSRPEMTTQAWEQAIKSFQAVIELDPVNKKAKHNVTKVKKELEELKKKQQNQAPKSREQKNRAEQQKKEKTRSDKQSNQQKDYSSKKNNNNEKDINNKDIKSKERQKTDPPSTPSSNEKNETQRNSPPKPIQNQEGSTRRALGKMTKKEAEELLDMLKEEEKRLNFIPVPQYQNEEPQNNW